MKITLIYLSCLLTLITALMPGCTQAQQSQSSQVRGETPEVRRDYGNPPAMDDWKQRGASGLPTGEKGYAEPHHSQAGEGRND